MSKLTIDVAPVFFPLLRQARYKGIYGGRGSGKSHFVASQIIAKHISKRTDTVCLREVQKSLQFSSKKLLENKIESMNAGLYFDVQDKVIKARNGGIIIFQGMQDHTAESIKSLEGFSTSWFEEAQSASQRSLDLLRPTMRSDSELWFTWNPHRKTDPIEILLRGEYELPGSIVVEANWHQNPWIPKDLLDEMEIDRSGNQDKFNWIWGGKYLLNTDGDYFKNEFLLLRARGGICRIPKLDVPVNTFWDIGNSDGCAVWFHQRVGMEDRFIGYYEAHGETLGHYAREVQKRGHIYNKHFMPHDADHKRLSDTNKSVKQMMRELGLQNIQIVPVISDLNTGIQMARKHLASCWFDLEDCKLGIDRLTNYQKRFNRADNRWIDEPNKSNGCSEGADAFRQFAQAKEAGNVTIAGKSGKFVDEHQGYNHSRSHVSPGSWMGF